MSRLKSRMREMLQGYRLRPNESFRAITLTVRSMPDLALMAKFVHKSFRTLRNRKLWRSLVSGGCFVAEITGRPGNWHYHLHIIAASYFMPWANLLNAWQQITGSTGVYIQRISSRKILGYLTSYVLKGADRSLNTLEMSEQLRGVRMFNPFGLFFKMLRPYKKKPFRCPSCGAINWMPWDSILRLYEDYRGPDYTRNYSTLLNPIRS